MTEPQIPQYEVQPSPEEALRTGDFGPDFTKTATDPPLKEDDPRKPKSAKRPGGILGNLGQNKKARSGIRTLTDADEDKIATLYTSVAMVMMPFKPKMAQKMAECSEQCAKAWRDLAAENDNVRRVLLMCLEGGVWGAVLAAHAPILIAALPDEFMPFKIEQFNPNPEDFTDGAE